MRPPPRPLPPRSWPRATPLVRALMTVALASLPLLCGCAPVPSSAPEIGGGVVEPPRPADAVELPAAPGSATAPPDSCGDPLASLRPTGQQPAPGRMPAGSTMERIQQRGKLIAGVDQNTYLMGFRNPLSGQLEGFDVDMVREVAAAVLGDRDAVQFKVLTSDERIPALERGEVDIVVRTMTVNCERRQRVDFSAVYYLAGQKVLVPTSSDADGIEDLGGRRVCATKGSSSLTNVAAAPSRPIAVGVPNWTDCLVMLQQGQVDAISTDDTILAGFAAQDPYTKVVGPRFTTEPYGMAVPRHHEDFVRFVNGVLERLRADGTWAAIHRRWLGDPPAPPEPVYRD
ncbi:polar amino acid transport system substrate-binding protein [Saccharothrix coeruleofusca]|uniref:glutamate ABC transporter substrate-binding protein n=1 Tax=Saccharothrix coeruleofusca TaxID=33919 RepID=UPI0027DE2C21|nr:glutamate ABC transporter substrate-binding protein [Saccharothrix coeruleofusca]MBP2336423.1 polar amino acid transport system substrate-binding protein [Saccharothrix coeruleofusca]